MNKKFGFTLAEVLITLGIIGVVAAMTIPTLIANTNSAKFRSQFKKSISTLNQAGLMAQAQYDVDYSSVTGCTGTDDSTAAGKNTVCAIFNGTLSGHSIATTSPYGNSDPDGVDVEGTPYYVTLADGSMVILGSDFENCTKSVGGDTGEFITNHQECVAYIDVNGKTLPNTLVSCDEGSSALGDGTCSVSNDAAHMTDIYPVVFHDATVEPASPAARTVLTTAK